MSEESQKTKQVSSERNRSAKKYELLLAGAIATRATSFIFSKMLLQTLSSFNLLGIRFLFAFLLLALLFCKKLRQVTGREIRDEAGLVEAVRGLVAGGIPYVAASRGAEGVVFACADGVFRGVVPDVRAVNPVGCGDSMVAAFAVGLARRLPALEMLRLALAVSAASAMDEKTGSLDKRDLAAVSERVRVERIG